MNRLPSLKASKYKHSISSNQLFANSYPTSRTTPELGARRVGLKLPLQHALFAPLHYERNYAYPLVVWLHSEGGSERELRRVMPHVSLRNYVAAAPRGRKLNGQDATGFTWLQSPAAAGEAEERVRQCVEAAKARFNVNDRRVFIAGCGVGGTMALRLALQSPDQYAGAITLGGGMPEGNCPLKSVNSARGLPLMVASNIASREYPQSQVARDLRLLHSAGFALAIKQYVGDHDLSTCMLADMDRWIMDRVCAESGSLAGARR
jgi:phospholipase/carboxylesterase